MRRHDNTTTSVTQILAAVSRGDGSAREQLWSLVYDELHRVAQHQMANEVRGHTLQTTALVNEAYLRLVGDEHVHWTDRVNGGIPWIFSWDVGFTMIPNRWLSVTRQVGQSSSRIGGSQNLPRPRLKEYAEVGHNFAPAAAEMGRSTDADSDGNVRKPFRKNLVPDA